MTMMRLSATTADERQINRITQFNLAAWRADWSFIAAVRVQELQPIL